MLRGRTPSSTTAALTDSSSSFSVSVGWKQAKWEVKGMMVEYTGVVLQYFNLEINSCMFGLLPTRQPYSAQLCAD